MLSTGAGCSRAFCVYIANALPWRKTLAMLEFGAESIIVPVRADEEKLSPEPWRLSFLCTLAPTAAVLYTFMRCSPSEALRSQYRPQ